MLVNGFLTLNLGDTTIPLMYVCVCEWVNVTKRFEESSRLKRRNLSASPFSVKEEFIILHKRVRESRKERADVREK